MPDATYDPQARRQLLTRQERLQADLSEIEAQRRRDMSAPRRRVLQRLACGSDADVMPERVAAELAGLSPRSLLHFRDDLVEDGLVDLVHMPGSREWGLRIAGKGRAALEADDGRGAAWLNSIHEQVAKIDAIVSGVKS